MKILMVNKFLHPNGGSETYIHKIGSQLQADGHEVQYFGMNHPKRIVGNRAEIYTEEMNFRGGGKRFQNPFTIIYSGEAYRKMMAILQDYAPDVVHINNFNFQLTPSILYAIKKYGKKMGKKIPVIATAHDYQWVCPNHMMRIPVTGELCFRCQGGKFIHCFHNKCIHGSGLKSLLGSIEGYFYRMRKTYQLFDVVICPSEFMNRTLSTNPVFARKTVTMHNFADCSRDAAMRKGDYVLYFGRMAEEKGVDMLLEVCRRLPEIPFIFAGGGPLVEAVKRVENIQYMGFLEGLELEETIGKARFSLFPSIWYENCPFSLIETQTFGTPVIARDLGGAGELVTHEKTGLLLQDNEADTWVNAIRGMWENKKKCEEFSENCKKIPFYTLKQYCDILLGIYEKELNNR